MTAPWSRVWRRLVGRRPIVTRLVLAVAVAMTVVLLGASGFVFWRVDYALNRQLDQDLRAWNSVVERAIAANGVPPAGTPGLKYQVYDAQGRQLAGSTGLPRLATVERVRQAVAGDTDDYDVGGLLPASAHAYRVRTTRLRVDGQRRVVLSVINRAHRDEALRELMLQLAIADLLTLAAASFVGYRTARAALDPVEAYRQAASRAQGETGTRLPVAEDRHDELSRLGHTFNSLLDRIGESATRERQFLADAAHELRTPLTLMTAELDWATLRRRSPEEMRGTLTSLRAQVARLVHLANALLDLEEVRASGSLDQQPVPVAEVADDAVRDALPPGTDVAIDVPGDLIAAVDRRWLVMAVANLLRNALRHGAEPITVTGSSNDGRLEIVVRDRGPGFPASFRAHAFDRFSRAEEARSTPGSGLGLHLVLSVAEAHGGTAEILDEPGGAVRLVLDVRCTSTEGAESG